MNVLTTSNNDLISVLPNVKFVDTKDYPPIVTKFPGVINSEIVLIQTPNDPTALGMNARLTNRRIQFEIRLQSQDTLDGYRLPLLYKKGEYLCNFDEFQYIKLDDLV